MDFKDYLIEEAKAKNIHISLLQAEKFVENKAVDKMIEEFEHSVQK